MLNVAGNKLSISGWAINPSGVKSVEVFVDGKSKGNATYGIARPDVKAVYTNYLNADKSGFSANLDVSDIQGGTRTVKIRQTGIDGSVFSSEGTINIDRPAPIMNIDSPSNNSTISGNSLFVGGWVLNNFGVKEVQIYVDGKFKGNADINLARPDVKSVYPQYTNAANSGFSKTVSISDIAGGNKIVEIKQVCNDGSSVSMKTNININKPNPIGCIDAPIDGAKVNGKTINVSGWALNSSNIKSVDIFVDGIAKGSATIGQPRPDVKSVYPQYTNAAISGFSKEVNIEDVAGGEKILKVVETGNDGTVYTNEARINIAKLQPITTVDTPGNGQSVSGDNLTISGWTINPAGIKQVKVYIDGTYVQDASIGISRPDVKAVYPQYNYAEKSGFRTNLDINNIPNGSRKIKVEQIGNDGTGSSVEIPITINRPEPIGCIDYPGYGESIDGSTLSLGGWVLNATGIKEVNVYIDDVLLGKANTGISRPDVKTVYPQYKNADKSGYNANIDIRDIKGGVRKLRVEQVGNDGSKSSVSINININKPTPIECIDTPISEQSISGKTLKISGWALNPSGVSKVEIYVDGKYKGVAQLGISRTDVAKAFPRYANGDKSGYSATVDINDVAPGRKTVEVRQYGNDGGTHFSLVSVNIQKKNPMVNIDSPSNNRVEQSDSLYVGGWTLNESGISKINVYVDDNKVASPTLTMNRPDVIAAFPGYQTSQLCGYQLSIGISNLAVGPRHTLKVESIGIDGTVATSTSTFYYKKKNTLIVIDPGHNYGGDYGADSSFNGVYYSETELNMLVAIKLQSNLQAQGYQVVMTRRLGERSMDDLNTSLRNRAILANDLNADLFISIHHNSAEPNTTARGSEVYYTERTSNERDAGMPPHNPDKFTKSRDLAIGTAERISSNTGFANRGGKGDVSSLGFGLSVLRNTKMPAILVECGYISNPTEASLLANNSIQQATANGITQAVKARY
nr:Ig-like domain-containing protein [Clostridium cibarium]